MTIRRVRIHGYRSLEDVTWEPAPLNIVIGANSSGKSNLLRSFRLLREAARGKLAESILREGGTTSIRWDGRAERLGWMIDVDDIEFGFLEVGRFHYELLLVPLPTTGGYYVDRELLTGTVEGRDKGTVGKPREFFHRAFQTTTVLDDESENGKQLDRPMDLDAVALATLRSSFGPLEAISSLADHIEAWRLHDRFDVGPDSPIRTPVVTQHAKRVLENGSNLVPVLHTLYSEHRDFRATVNDAMAAAFGQEFEELTFPPAADQRVQMRLKWRSLKTSQSAADLSDGTLRFLLLIAILATPDPAPLIAIDEPEAGLHPRMFPIIADLAREAAERTQIVFTTHSPPFLDAFGSNSPQIVVAALADGATKLSVLDSNELVRWLREYSMGALFRSGELESLT